MIRTPGADLERIQTPKVRDGDEQEARLRPQRLDEFVGQEALKAQLELSIRAARSAARRSTTCCSPARRAWARRRSRRSSPTSSRSRSSQTAGPALERKGEIAAFLTDLEPRSVFFVDEIHRLPRAVEETFYPAMEDGQLPITLGDGAGREGRHARLPPFTLIGATTRAGLLTTPLRDRFGIQHRLDHYDADELARDRRPQRRRPRRRGRTWTARARSPSAAAARRAWPTACSSACATTRRSTATAASTPRSPTRRWTCSRWTTGPGPAGPRDPAA